MTATDTVKDLPQAKRCPECATGFGADAAFCPFDGIPLETCTWDPSRDALIGVVIDGRYEIIAPLGEGGMGTVYKVRHMTLDRMFAMKVLRRDLAADGALAARFLQEARATALIRDPAVVAISDFGSLDDGAPYFVMDLVVGETLATRMRTCGLLSPREAASIARKLADALSAAHAANVVHRDLKPENVFLVPAAGKESGDDVRIVDFGAAKIVGGSKLTRPGVVFGTPYYMSPEQASGQPVDARADIYSLGVLLYEMVTGALPFEADTYMGVLTKHMFATPVKPSERTPSGVQLGGLEAVVLRALEKEPSARYASMAELAEALEAGVDGRTPARSAADRRAGAPADRAMSSADRIERSVTRHLVDEERRRRRTLVISIVAAAATLGLCALAISVIDGAGSSRSASTVLSPAPARSAPEPAPEPTRSAAPALAPVSTVNIVPAVTSAPPSGAGSAPPVPPAVASGMGAGPVPATPSRAPVVLAPARSAATAAPAPRPSATASAAKRRPSDELPDPWAR